MKSKKFKFSEEQKERIRLAVADLEAASSGEIVPYYTAQSDDYEVARWKMAAVFGFLGALILGLASYFWLLPFSLTPFEDALFFILLMFLGFIIPLVYPAVSRSMVDSTIMKQKVFDRATTVFLEEEIFKTRDRTGVLIYISALEREVVVLADSGINKKVKPEDWQKIVNLVIAGIKANKVDEGLVNAIQACKKLLLDNGFTVRPDDKNELPDNLRLED
ncbi:TPM domain-containing protein [Fulvivirga sp. 2943]|uniref:TPM domain-containing protein n=2 Tax=Fulvivirga sediminis TaxID=2803949 RepID=A0A937K1I0_9BACT|nr:TPM domain-containing protein [Fulvivirga sediminis]